jgi:hypothetical protein
MRLLGQRKHRGMGREECTTATKCQEGGHGRHVRAGVRLTSSSTRRFNSRRSTRSSSVVSSVSCKTRWGRRKGDAWRGGRGRGSNGEHKNPSRGVRQRLHWAGSRQDGDVCGVGWPHSATNRAAEGHEQRGTMARGEGAGCEEWRAESGAAKCHTPKSATMRAASRPSHGIHLAQTFVGSCAASTLPAWLSTALLFPADGGQLAVTCNKQRRSVNVESIPTVPHCTWSNPHTTHHTTSLARNSSKLRIQRVECSE